MDEEDPASCLSLSEERTASLYPMYFGVSCAFVSLGLLSGLDADNVQWSQTRDRMLQGSAHLLGLLVWRIQREDTKEVSDLHHKLEKTERELEELKRRRNEDAMANEKAVSIFAAQEQSWLSERKKLQHQTGALINKLQVLEIMKEEVTSKLNEKVQEKELLIQYRDEALGEEEKKRKELEEKLQKAEAVVEELRETLKIQAEDHSSKLWKYKTAFFELVSNQRQLEAEMGRALQQVDAARQDLELVFNQKEESVSMIQKLSMEIIKMSEDLEQQDKILSVMLRKSKLDTVEKQMLLKEVKASKTRRKQSELETESWRAIFDSRHEMHSSRLEVFYGSKVLHPIEAGCSRNQRTGFQPIDNRVNAKNLLLQYVEAEHRKERGCDIPQKTDITTSYISDQYPPEASGEPENESTAMLGQKRYSEIDALAEQIRVRDEKLEAFSRQLLNMVLESKQLQVHIEGLEQNLSQLREENMKLEALLLDRDVELESVKEKFSLQLHPIHFQKTNSNSYLQELALDRKSVGSNVKLIKRKPPEIGQDLKTALNRLPKVVETEKVEHSYGKQSQDMSSTIKAPKEEIKAEKGVALDHGPAREECMGSKGSKVAGKLASVSHCWKMDFHALGVSHKIKILRQQLLTLEKLEVMQKGCEDREIDCHKQTQIKGFLLLMSLLNKQVSKYESLQEKTDYLCKQMHGKDPDSGGGDSSISKTKAETMTLEHFVEETFQLQRYVVASGQRLMEIQSRITAAFAESNEEFNGSPNFDMRRFANCVVTLFKEVQKGLEVRIARIIGDLEGTLACHSIVHLKGQFSVLS